MLPLCIVFDLDDTLYLERDYVFSGFRAVENCAALELRGSDFAGHAWRLFQSGGGKDTLQQALAAIGRTAAPDLISEMLRIYRGHDPDIALLPDAVHCLSEVKTFAKLGLITDGRAEGQRLKCARLGLPSIVQNIVCTGAWGDEYCKPHPRAFEFMENRPGLEGHTFVYVADNPRKDFATPLVRGWRTVRVRRLAGLHAEAEPLPGLEPHVEVQDLWGLPQIAKSLTGSPPLAP